MKEIDRQIGSNLRQIRQDSDLTQEQLGAKVHLHHSAIARFEAGNRSLTADHIARFSIALNVEVNKLFE